MAEEATETKPPQKQQRRGKGNKRPMLGPVPPLFFAMKRAALTDFTTITKRVELTIPCEYLSTLATPAPASSEKAPSSGPQALVEKLVLRQYLHRAYRGENGPTTIDPAASDEKGYLMVVDLQNISHDASTARQANYRGDVQIQVTADFTVAKVEQHGILVGVAHACPLSECMRVVLPCGTKEAGKKRSRGEEAKTDEVEHSVAARCPEEEPVIAGQSVIVVTEPGSIRCLAIRPPRAAPGPFRITSIVDEASASQTASGKTKKKKKSANADAITKLSVECLFRPVESSSTS